ncbi:helicase DnaB [Streptomyces sp. Ru73]|nr:helicase DnaB [Streptomyces sp. Ru73]
MQAEQAVLGAALLEPRQLSHLAGWLRPEHFYRPTHSALYAALLDLRAEGHPATKAPPVTPVPLAWVNDTRDRASAHTRGITASFMHSLVSACPRPGHASVYGRMVLEGAIHRSVTEHADRLHQAARDDAARGTGVEESLHHAQVLTDVLDDLARRWGTEPRPAPTAKPSRAPAPPCGIAEERLLADEELLLGTLVAHPKELPEVMGWLRPEDFVDPGHDRVYRALGALHHRGEPVDQLTVLWECQRRGALADSMLDADRVRRLCNSAAGGSAGYFGEQVIDASLLRTAAYSARQVRVLAGNEALAPGRLISQATAALVPLDEVRRRRAKAAADSEPKYAPDAPLASPPPVRSAAARARSSLSHTGISAQQDRSAPPPSPVRQRPRKSRL